MKDLCAFREEVRLKTDLGETNNVAMDNPRLVKQMEKRFKSARTDSKLWPIREGAAATNAVAQPRPPV
jgi:hypothetical protein